MHLPKIILALTLLALSGCVIATPKRAYAVTYCGEFYSIITTDKDGKIKAYTATNEEEYKKIEPLIKDVGVLNIVPAGGCPGTL